MPDDELHWENLLTSRLDITSDEDEEIQGAEADPSAAPAEAPPANFSPAATLAELPDLGPGATLAALPPLPSDPNATLPEAPPIDPGATLSMPPPPDPGATLMMPPTGGTESSMATLPELPTGGPGAGPIGGGAPDATAIIPMGNVAPPTNHGSPPPAAAQGVTDEERDMLRLLTATEERQIHDYLVSRTGKSGARGRGLLLVSLILLGIAVWAYWADPMEVWATPDTSVQDKNPKRAQPEIEAPAPGTVKPDGLPEEVRQQMLNDPDILP